MQNYYDVLEISYSASDSVIKAAYKALVKKYHPDNCTQYDEEKICQINEAYACLSSPEKKKIYDQQLCANRDMENHRQREMNDEVDADSFHRREKESRSHELSHHKSFFSQIVSGVVDGMQESFDRRHQQIENAYMEALDMSDYYLIRKYTSVYGAERIGYAKVLEERGYLRRGNNGQWIPTGKNPWFGGNI